MMLIIDRSEVQKNLTFDVCIPLMAEAMIALSNGATSQLTRQILPLKARNAAFGIMPGSLGEESAFGAKLVSVFPNNSASGKQSHQGIVVLFDPNNGVPVAIVHAGEITAIRTAATSAAATDALAKRDAKRLAILGTGEQAKAHLKAIPKVRPIHSVIVWDVSYQKAQAFAESAASATGMPVEAARNVQVCVADADIVCTVTSAKEPILQGGWVKPGTHLNVVGSSYAGPAEISNDLVARSRFFVDHREAALKQAAEFLHAKEANMVDDNHILAEIGDVLSGNAPGRLSDDDVTIYKSLGNVVQDLASAVYLFRRSTIDRFGLSISFS
jgi:ornithine cyclodeaminase/alanine dehydrogenase-like protein (mu-crystallin family)